MGIDLFRKIKNAFNLKSLLESEVSDLTDKLQKTDFNSIPSFRILNIDGLRHQKNKFQLMINELLELVVDGYAQEINCKRLLLFS